MQHRTHVRLRCPQRGTPVRFLVAGGQLLPRTASLWACQHPSGGYTPETGGRPSEWLCGRLRANGGYAPPLEPPVEQLPANCSNGEQVFDPTSPPHTPPEGLAVQDWVTPHPDPRRPSGGLYGALVEAQVRSHLPGEQQQRGVQPAPALYPGRPDHTGRKGVPPGGRWSAFRRARALLRVRPLALLVLTTGRCHVFVPAPVTNWRGRRACSGVSPRRARRCGSVGWRPWGSHPSRGP